MPIRKETLPVQEPAPAAPAIERQSAAVDAGYHDAISGRPIDAHGRFIDAGDTEEPVEPHRIVANDWPTRRDTSPGDRP